MQCPHCGAEVGEDRATCPACAKPIAEADEWVDFVTVMTTRDHSELAVAKSLLEGAGIEYFARNEEVESLIAAGPVELQVHPDDEEEARELLRELEGEGEE
jgi:RNA polymerase subunit RPABC4/transcription elongation factor Spt4